MQETTHDEGALAFEVHVKPLHVTEPGVDESVARTREDDLLLPPEGDWYIRNT